MKDKCYGKEEVNMCENKSGIKASWGNLQALPDYV